MSTIGQQLAGSLTLDPYELENHRNCNIQGRGGSQIVYFSKWFSRHGNVAKCTLKLAEEHSRGYPATHKSAGKHSSFHTKCWQVCTEPKEPICVLVCVRAYLLRVFALLCVTRADSGKPFFGSHTCTSIHNTRDDTVSASTFQRHSQPRQCTHASNVCGLKVRRPISATKVVTVAKKAHASCHGSAEGFCVCRDLL